MNKVGLSLATVAKMGKGESIADTVLEKISSYLECNISEIMKYE